MQVLIEPLSGQAFAPFGDVIEVSDAARHFSINAGYAERYHDLARVEVASAGGRPLISIFRARTDAAGAAPAGQPGFHAFVWPALFGGGGAGG